MNNLRGALLLLGAALQVLGSAGALAADLEYPVGSMVAYPVASVSAGYRGDVIVGDDNDQKGALYVSASLGGGLQGENRGHLYGVEYVLNGGVYFDDKASDENFLDQRLVAYWGTAFNQRNNVDVGVELLSAHDPRGEEDPTLGTRHSTDAPEPDEWNQAQVGGLYVFGADGARGKLKLSACETCRRYQNNDQEYRDLDVFDLGATLYARVSPKVYGLLQFVQSDFNYVNQGVDDPTMGRSLDSIERRYLVGAEWEATRRTTGRVRVGWLDKDFDSNSDREDYSDLTWDLGVSWTPRSYSNLDLNYFRQTYETVYTDENFLDDYVEVQEVGAWWRQLWGSRFSTNVGAYRGWDEFHPSDRSDDRYGVALGVDYVLGRWGSVGVTYAYQQRDSSDPLHDYDDSSLMLRLNIGELFGFGYNERGPNICDLRGGSRRRF